MIPTLFLNVIYLLEVWEVSFDFRDPGLLSLIIVED